jgi:phosphoribosylformimino-5-aminoimidazole carboxamide ribotide isomerase
VRFGAGSVRIRIVPVLDIVMGRAVHAVGGVRQNYQALSGELSAVVRLEQLLRQFGCETAYVADLDAIVDSRPQLSLVRQLASVAGHLWLDAGICTNEALSDLQVPGNATPIIGSETAVELDILLQTSASADLIFSLDLRQGTPISADPGWQGLSSIEFARQLVRRGASKLILLDLAAVGVGEGVPTLPLCRQLKQESPELFLITGGGVRSPDCLLQARDAGVDALLVASALHDGRITPEDISRVTGGKG